MIAENPKITELKPYKGFNILKIVTYKEWGRIVSYEAYREKAGYVTDYIDEYCTLKDCKQAVDIYLIDKKKMEMEEYEKNRHVGRN